jgi:hypothetical protein
LWCWMYYLPCNKVPGPRCRHIMKWALVSAATRLLI